MLQKGIADVVIAQLMHVYAELRALQACATRVVQMARAKVHRSELEEKVLEIEEKEDNHIAYLKAQLKDLSLVEEDKKVDDESEGQGAQVWKELGHVSPQLTMPPLTPGMPSTNQQVDKTVSVASIAWKREGPLTSAGVDQWSIGA